MNEPPSSPPSDGATTADKQLAWYKSQYEQLEADLAEFRESSRELEQELEKDIERAEKQERVLQERAEGLSFEVEEWKRKYKESKLEAGSAQATLEKEITRLRDSNRTLQLKLRDIEVANDDFERQARNTTSSLEDMESKYNQAIERAVLMDEEVRIGEQEREKLRIESQRLREEYSDLKIEADILQDKLKKQESRHLSAISTDFSIIGSPTFDKTSGSPHSTTSSPMITTPTDTKSIFTANTLSELHDPPSPPMSDASAHYRTGSTATVHKTPAGIPPRRPSRLPSIDNTPKLKGINPPRMPGSRPSVGGTIPPGRTSARTNTLRSSTNNVPGSNSLTHIRSLTAQMQRLEARVQSARSKLPAPTYTPPRPSPYDPVIPSSITVRSRKRTVGSTTSSVAGDDITPSNFRSSTNGKSHASRINTIGGISRLSFGHGPQPNRGPESDISRPSSRASLASSVARPASRTDLRGSVSNGRPASRSNLKGSISSGRPVSRTDLRGSISSTPRPASRTDLRTSYASLGRPSSRTEMMTPSRPMSRTSMSGTRTPMRPRSSMSGPLHSHAHSSSVSHFDLEEEDEDEDDYGEETPSGRGGTHEDDEGGIPVPGSSIPSSGTIRRKSHGRRPSIGVLREPARPKLRGAMLGDLGETY